MSHAKKTSDYIDFGKIKTYVGIKKTAQDDENSSLCSSHDENYGPRKKNDTKNA